MPSTIFIFLLVGCLSGPDVESSTEQAVHIGQGNLAVAPDGPAISVCWGSDAFPWWDTRRSIIRQAIDRTWGREGPKAFVDWNDCSSGSYDVHIGHSDQDRSYTYWTPSVPFVHDGGWQINFRDIPSDRLWQTATHEFGHSFGLVHEHTRSDTPAFWASQPCAAEDGDFIVIGDDYGDWDLDSIMNYCDPMKNGELSGWDVVGFHHYHGSHFTGSLVSALYGRCVQSGDAGSDAIAGICQRPDQTIWGDLIGRQQRYEYKWGTKLFQRVGTNTCLAKVGTRAQAASCNASDPAQRFDIADTGAATAGQFRGVAGKCLRRGADAGMGNGSRYLELGTCTGSRDEMFMYDAATREIHDADGMRVDVQWGTAQPGTPVWTWPANGGDAQKWNLVGRSLQTALWGSQLRLATDGNRSDDGAPIVISGTGGSSTVWTVHVGMQLRGYGSRCLDLAVPSAAPGTPVRLNDCSESSTQFWVYDPTLGAMRNHNGACLDIVGGVAQISDCAGLGGRRWFLDDGRLKMAGSCLAPQGHRPVPGTALVAETCDGSTAQDWHFAGAIKQGGQCAYHVDPENGGGLIQFSACNEGESQRWDYYPVGKWSCGDRVCQLGEWHAVCPADCAAPPRCGDGVCNGTDTCVTCSSDCGVCRRVCGDDICEPSERFNCPLDCV